MTIRTATLKDAPAITEIYNHYVQHSYATLEYETVAPSFYENKIRQIQDEGHHWLVATGVREDVQGYAYSHRWNARDGYDQTCEVSVYIHPDAQGKGIGSRLYTDLFERLQQDGMHSMLAVIGLPNEGSIALHEKFGMYKTAHFKELGKKFGKWLDVGYWYRNL